jgi:putative oxidoreductase
LLLRIACAAPLLVESVAFISNSPHWPPNILIELAGLGCGGMIAVGFFTPVASFCQVLLQMWLGIHDTPSSLAGHGLLAVIGAVLMMTGPGAWSVDARLFGRKRIDMVSG